MKALFALLLLVTLSAQVLGAEFATVALVRGDAQSLEQKLKAGDRLAIGARVTTGERSFVRIKFDNKIALQAGANSEFVLTRNEKKDNTLVDVVKGGILSRIKPSTQFHERFTVKTPQAVMGVRGTTFFTHVDAGKPTFLCVCEGKVSTRHHGKEELIKTTKHDRPVEIGDDLVAATTGVDHSDEDIRALDQLLGN